MGAKKGHYFMFLIGFGTPSESMSFLEMSCSHTFLSSLYLNMAFKICSIDLIHSL
jgi:hypothetical protein